MAEASGEQDCIDRHTAYPIDVYKQSLNSLQRKRLDRLYAMPPQGCKLLDIGCNSGYVALWRPDCECHGVDVSPELAAKASRRMASASVAPAERLPFPDGHFDAAVLGEILEHVQDPRKVLAEAARVSTAMLCGSTPHSEGNWGSGGMHPPETHKFHVRVFRETGLLRLLSGFGKPSLEIVGDSRPQMWLFRVGL